MSEIVKATVPFPCQTVGLDDQFSSLDLHAPVEYVDPIKLF